MAEIPGDDWIIERLGSNHDRSFFLRQPRALRLAQAESQPVREAGPCSDYVATRRGETVVLGYYAISNLRVSHKALPADQAKGLPRLDVPVVLLGRLAVDGSAKGRGLGSLLLIDALRRAEYLSGQVGIRAVEVDAIDEAARNFYIHNLQGLCRDGHLWEDRKTREKGSRRGSF